MNWEAVGAVGEILGAAAVVITLVYLVAQLRLNTTAIKAQTRSSLTDQMLAIVTVHSTNPRLVDAELKTMSGAPIDATEQRLMYMYRFAWFRQWENQFYQFRHRMLDESEFSSARNSWVQVLDRPDWREEWHGIKSQFSPEFVVEIDSILNETAGSRPSTGKD